MPRPKDKETYCRASRVGADPDPGCRLLQWCSQSFVLMFAAVLPNSADVSVWWASHELGLGAAYLQPPTASTRGTCVSVCYTPPALKKKREKKRPINQIGCRPEPACGFQRAFFFSFSLQLPSLPSDNHTSGPADSHLSSLPSLPPPLPRPLLRIHQPSRAASSGRTIAGGA